MRNIKLLHILVLGVVLVLTACAAGTKETVADREPGVVKAIEIADLKISVQVNKPFDYTIYKPGDPFTVVVELPEVDPGQFKDKITSDKKGITEINVVASPAPKVSTKLEILLQTPAKLIPEVQGTTLVLSVEGGQEVSLAAAPIVAPQDVSAPVTPPAQDKVEQAAVPAPAPAEVKPEPAPEPTPVVVAPVPVVAQTDRVSITGIKFERAAEALKVIIETDGATKPNVFPLDQKIVIDFKDVKLKAKAPKEVVAPVKGIRTGESKGKTRIVLDLSQKASYDVVAIGNSVTVSLSTPDMTAKAPEPTVKPAPVPVAKTEQVKPAPEPTKAEVPAPAEAPAKVEPVEKEPPVASKPVEPAISEPGVYRGKRISLDFQDADIVPIFRLFADVSGNNVVVSPEVKGKITMKLINVPWDQALDLVLRTHNLGKQIDGNIIRIAPNSELTKERDESVRAHDALIKSRPMTTRVITINYAGVDRIKESITKAQMMSPRGSMTVDERASVIVINDVEDSFPRILNLVKQLDKPELQVRQVLLEARIVEARTNYVKDIGIAWGIWGRSNDFQLGVGGTGQTGGTGFTGNNFLVNMPAAVQRGTGGAIGLGYINAARTLGLDLQLSALERTGGGKVVSNPRIITMNNTPAKITQGTTIYVPVATSDKTDVKAIDANLTLEATPSIAPGGAVLIKLKITKDEPGDIVAGNISINRNSAETATLVNNGDTVVIGGIYKHGITTSTDAIPWFHKIPIIGALFKHDVDQDQTSEILIFITPRLVNYDLPKEYKQ